MEQLDHADDVEAALAVITDAIAQIEAAQANLIAAVAATRELGWTWAKVGDALEITRQAAWERFHRQIDSGETLTSGIQSAPRGGRGWQVSVS
jgi:hypothetical protein